MSQLLTTQQNTATEQAKKRVVVIDPFQRQQELTLVAVYARVSSDSEDQEHSLSAQTSHYRRLVKAHESWRLVDIYADEGITGTSTEKRDEFHRLMRDCRRQRVNRVLVKSVSRFCRNTTDSIEAVRELTKLGVTIFFEKEGIDTATMPSEFVLTTMSHFAQAESVSISGNMKRSVRMRMEMGTYINPSTAYGYEYVDGKMVVNEKQAAVVRWIFDQYLSGMGIHRITLALSMVGIPRADENPNWNERTVSYLLTNEKYVGDCLCQKSYSTDTLPFKKKMNYGEKDQFLIENIHTPIIDRDTYERVQKRIAQKGEALHGPRHNPPRYPFTRLVACGHCGSLYRRKLCRDKAYWVCNKSNREGSSVCPAARIPEPLLHEVSIRAYNKLKSGYSIVLEPLQEQLHTLKRTVSLSNHAVAEYNEKILQLAEQNSMLAGLVAKGIMDSTLAIPQINENERQMRELKSKSTQLTYNEKLDTLIETTSVLCHTIQNGPARMDTLDEHLFRGVIEKIVVVDREHITLCLTNGLQLREQLDWTVIK